MNKDKVISSIFDTLEWFPPFITMFVLLISFMGIFMNIFDRIGYPPLYIQIFWFIAIWITSVYITTKLSTI